MTHLKPDIGNWYENIDNGELFEVVAVDNPHQTVEVQYLDGSLGEFDLEQWRGLPVIGAVAPEDANIAFGISAHEQDQNTAELSKSGSPLDTIESELFDGTDESND